MGLWCVATGQSPETYMRFTVLERNAFWDAAIKLTGR